MLVRKAAAPASPALTIVLCFIVALIEGFDLQAAGIAAPHIRRTFVPRGAGRLSRWGV